jgi:hypothetical protein
VSRLHTENLKYLNSKKKKKKKRERERERKLLVFFSYDATLHLLPVPTLSLFADEPKEIDLEIFSIVVPYKGQHEVFLRISVVIHKALLEDFKDDFSPKKTSITLCESELLVLY